VTEPGQQDSTAPGAYQLNYDLDGSSYAVRENLVDIIRREILGPVRGAEEILPISPRAQYLVGHIAPVKLTGSVAAAEPDTDDARGDLAEVSTDETGAAEGRGVPSLGADVPTAEVDDDDDEDRTPQKGLMIPASMGLRFQVPADQETVTVTATWGVYTAVDTGEVSKSGRPIREYRRTPVEEVRTVRLGDLRVGPTETVPLREQVVLRIDRYDDAPRGRMLVEIALCNDRETPVPIPLSMWMFQTQLRVDASGAEIFLPVRDLLEHTSDEFDGEVARLDLQYRDRLEYAIGRTCSADWIVKDGSRRATSVETTWIPTAQTPQTRATAESRALLSMRGLELATDSELRAGLAPLVDEYGAWIDGQEATAKTLPAHLQEPAHEALWEARRAHDRLAAGIEHVFGDPEALRCFRMMNHVMREQRLASQVAAARSVSTGLSIADARHVVEERGDAAATWFPFQLAFILMQLGALTDPTSPLRSDEAQATVELLFFPTGGGKTEAYLGLAAYAMAMRRRQGIVESAEGPLDGRDGVAVLMRYTLRLLTSQQFQRATALICAMELARLGDEQTWGSVPFRIGLWVGTAVSPKRFEEAEEQLNKANDGYAHRLTVLQIQRCPWCGTPVGPGDVRAVKATRRVTVHCGDELARCPFAKGGAVKEGLPILTVDEEIYRLVPAFVIATVDKFARLAREGEAAALFGYVARKCERHGYVHLDYGGCQLSGGSHPAKDGVPAASVLPTGRLRPPDLIIQDELHLITGALGTSVGLFEGAIETLCSWQYHGGAPVKPMIIAATATVRNAKQQVRALYGRQIEIFPPQVLDVADTYFSCELKPSVENPARLYIGISAQGVRLSSAEIRVAEVLLLAGQLLLDRSGKAADPYMTVVGYFNATRELAGMARYMADDVQTRVASPRLGSGFSRRRGTSFGFLRSGELTSRVASSEIGAALDRLGLEFDPAIDSTAAHQARAADVKAGKKLLARPSALSPYDVLLATSMLQVGVDVQRLGLMLVVGQPKNTAEYIQASSRVGRDATNRPGLVVSLGNWARPRDLAHFEQFRHYHETFYSQVEALSVTPYSPTSLDRGMSGLLTSAVRVKQASVVDGLSPERAAWRIEQQLEAVRGVAKQLEARIAAAAQSEDATQRAASSIANRIERWTQRSAFATARSQSLVYEKTGDSGKYLALLASPENEKAAIGGQNGAPFVVANSMREVQPEINLLVSPVPERLYAHAPEGVPAWELPADKVDDE
jgi:hypothetical protein